MRAALNILCAVLTAGCWTMASLERDVPAASLQPMAAPAGEAPLKPIWLAAVTDTGTQLTVLLNGFDPDRLGTTFPIESLVVRRFAVRGRSSEASETVVEGGRAAVRVRKNGKLESAFLRWRPTRSATLPARPGSAGLGEVPSNADLYCLSSDGQFLLALQLRARGVSSRGRTGSFGVLEYFDLVEARRPRRIGPPLEAEGALHNGAVSTDGSLVAIQILSDDGPSRKLVALRREANRLSAPLKLLAPQGSEGLQFADNFLLVGMEDPPRSVPTEAATSDTIALFDLRTWPK